MNIGMMLSKLAGGMTVTISIFVLTLLLSMPLGLIVSFGRMAKGNIFKTLIRSVTKVYISIMRGTPDASAYGCLLWPLLSF